MKYKSGFAHIFLILFAVLFVAGVLAYKQGIFAGSKSAIGSLDGADAHNCSVNGWALDPGAPSKSVKVHVYRDGPVGTGVKVAEVTANAKREDVNKTTGYKGDHGFVATFDASSEVKNAKDHKLYVYAISTAKGGKSTLLSGSPKTMNCEVLDACQVTADKFSFQVNLVTVDGRTIVKLDGVKATIALTDDAKANLVKSNLCIPGDLPKTSSSQGGVITFSSLPKRNFTVKLLTETIPKEYNLASGQSDTQTLIPNAYPNPVNANELMKVTFKIGSLGKAPAVAPNSSSSASPY